MKTKKVVMLISSFVFCLFLFNSGQLHAQDTLLKGAGCKTEYFLLKDLADAYKVKTGKKMQLGNTGNKKAVNLMLDQKIDFTFTCKPIKKLTKGLKLDPNAVSSWTSIPIGKDPIVVVASPKNGVKSLSTDQLTKLFKGEFASWDELGGNKIPVKTAYMSESLESGVVLLFKEFTVGSKGKLDNKAMIANGPSMLGNFTSVTPGAVTFMGFNSYKEKYGDILEIDGVAPTRENILNGTYALAATYYLTLDGSDNKGVSDFMDFINSEDGKQAIDQNFISVSQ